MTRFLVYTPPATGHVFPLVPGLRALVARGHEVHVRTTEELAVHLRVAGLTAEPVDERIAASARAVDPDGRRHADDMSDLMRRGPWEMADLTRAIAEVRPDALLVDSNTYGASTAAEASGLPWAMTMPSVLARPGRGIPPYGLGLAPRPGRIGALRDAVLWKVVERAFGRAMLPELNRMRGTAGLPPFRSPLDYSARPDLLITLTGAPLEYPRADLEPHVRMAGSTPWDPPAETPQWLSAEGDPWVLVTCSTDYQADGALAQAAVAALRDEPVRVLVTLADAYGEVTLPEAGNVRVERFVPHGAVLPHAAAVVCPSGMGIVSKAVAAGVPLVAVPFGRDQPEVARRVQQSGAGVILPAKKLSAARMLAAVRAARALPPRPATPADGGAAFADAAEELGVRAPAATAEPGARTAVAERLGG
ncbi:MAG TPA: glycosyltransferase [Actinoplanes sp.]|jgi:UDP:flavonoid glycosyltransferase YjiC (YdhE family)|nr:glycosyltransferase [Actinoplanes sp.]